MDRKEVSALAAVLFPWFSSKGYNVDQAQKQAIEAAARLIDRTEVFLAATPEQQTTGNWNEPVTHALLTQDTRARARNGNPPAFPQAQLGEERDG